MAHVAVIDGVRELHLQQVVPDLPPVQLLVLEAIALASAGVLVVVAIQGVRQ